MTLQEKLEIIKKGVEEIIPEEELIKKLKKSEETGKPLRIKYGIDPTGYDVHIGHLVPIRKMREFQDMGHIGVIIIGDFTAQIGDPTGRDDSRPPLTPEQVKANAEKYMEQLFTVLDPEKTEIRLQSEWFEKMGMSTVLNLLGKFTLAKFMSHDTFRKRYESGHSIGMHEIMYPVLQAYDSVAVEADIELGATEQKFNILCGRDMLKHFDKEEQVAVLSPILIGTDGVEKMSKSKNNYIAVFDSPKDKYGKVMSIPDNIIINYFKYATPLTVAEIKAAEEELKEGKTNPKIIKQRLAREIVKLYHGEKVAEEAENEFNRIFSQGNIPADIPEFRLTESCRLIDIMVKNSMCKTNGEARRMIRQNAVKIDDVKVDDENLEILPEKEFILKVGKRRFLKVSV
ncbi:MAG: tyrosine--tRNA ligase [Candidatus Cloacimonadota bacterium]|nr:MAG: tyrosine--tRNA ligase [Candidatus Cloacimonadota bacterium]